MQGNKWNSGDLLKDEVTGLEGIVMVVAFYATGCIHYGLQQRKTKEDGTVPDWQWIDQSQLKLKKKGVVQFGGIEQKPSGPSPKGPQL